MQIAETELGRHWKMVLAVMVGVAFGATGLPFYTLGLFVKPLGAEFGWSRAQVSTAGLCLQAGLIVASPFIGTLVDRFGSRRTALISMVGLVLGLLGLSAVTGNVLTLYAAWTALALLASGTTPIVWTRAVNSCFDRQRGLALGLSLAGTGLAAILGPMLMSQLIVAHGWRVAYQVLAAVTLLGALPFVALFLEEGTPKAPGAIPAGGSTLREALGTAWFWRSGASFFLIAGGIAALIVHLTPMLLDSGLTPPQAAGVAGLLGITIIVGRLTVGVLVDRLPAAYVGLAFLLLPVIACLLLKQGAAVPAALLIGLAAGAEVDLLAYLVSRRFGLRHYGRIYGWQLACFLLGAGVFPVVMGAARDRFGSYDMALSIDAVVILLGALGIGSLHRGGRSALAVAQ